MKLLSHHTLCQDEMWLEERFEDRLGPLSLLFSDQGAGKLSCLSEELVKEVAVSKGAEGQI